MQLMKYATQADLKMRKCVSSHKGNSSVRVDPAVPICRQRQSHSVAVFCFNRQTDFFWCWRMVTRTIRVQANLACDRIERRRRRKSHTHIYTHTLKLLSFFQFFFPIIFISWRLITLQYCSGFCHTLTWISHGFTCVPHPHPPSRLPPHPIPLGHPRAPAPSICLMHPTWTGDLFHTW